MRRPIWPRKTPFSCVCRLGFFLTVRCGLPDCFFFFPFFLSLRNFHVCTVPSLCFYHLVDGSITLSSPKNDLTWLTAVKKIYELGRKEKLYTKRFIDD